HGASTQCDGVPVFVEPEPVVQHPAGKGLLATGGSVVVAICIVNDRLALRANAGSLATIFAAKVSGERESHLVQEILWPVIVFHFNAVIGVNAAPSKLSISVAQRIFAHAVVVEDKRQPWFRTPENLASQSRFAAHSGIGLPAVDNPGLDLQLVCREPLD